MEPMYAQINKKSEIKSVNQRAATVRSQLIGTSPLLPAPFPTTVHDPLPAPVPSPMESIDIHAANGRGLINHSTGEVSLPQYGLNMLLDDAILQGKERASLFLLHYYIHITHM